MTEAEEFRISSDIKQANLEVLRGRLEQAEELLKRIRQELYSPTQPGWDEVALEEIENFLASQQGEQHSCKNCLGVDPESCMFKHSEQPEGFTNFPELLESVQQMDAMLKAEGAQGEREALPTWAPCNAACARDRRDRYCDCEQARAALAQPSPAPELERPEMAAWQYEPYLGGEHYGKPKLAFVQPYSTDRNVEPLMTVAQHERILRKALGDE